MDFEYQQHCTIQPPTSRLLSTDLAIIPSPCQSAPAAGPSLGREAAAVLAVEHISGEHFVPLCPICSGQTPPPCCRRSPRAAPALLLPIHPLRSPEGAAGSCCWNQLSWDNPSPQDSWSDSSHKWRLMSSSKLGLFTAGSLFFPQYELHVVKIPTSEAAGQN